MTSRGSPRPKRVGTYMTPSEKYEVQHAARLAGKSLAAFVRDVALSAARTERLPFTKPSETK